MPADRALIRLNDPSGRFPREVRLEPTPEALQLIATDLGLLGLRKVRIEGRLTPEGRHDWRLEAQIGATVVQPCVVTLVPVTTRIDEPVVRAYVESYAEPRADEAEIAEDDTIEPLPETLDLLALLTEALALALPLYPRAPGADLGAAQAAPPGVAPLTDEAARPFAALKALREPPEGADS